MPKLRVFGFLFFSIIELIVNSLRFFDLMPVNIIYKSFRSSLYTWTFDEIKKELNELKNFNYELCKTESEVSLNSFKILKDRNKFILSKKFKVFDKFEKKYSYFELKRI